MDSTAAPLECMYVHKWPHEWAPGVSPSFLGRIHKGEDSRHMFPISMRIRRGLLFLDLRLGFYFLLLCRKSFFSAHPCGVLDFASLLLVFNPFLWVAVSGNLSVMKGLCSHKMKWGILLPFPNPTPLAQSSTPLLLVFSSNGSTCYSLHLVLFLSSSTHFIMNHYVFFFVAAFYLFFYFYNFNSFYMLAKHWRKRLPLESFWEAD